MDILKTIRFLSFALLFFFGVSEVSGLCSTTQKICIVHATDSDETRFGTFPWPRRVHANLINKLEKTNPKYIVLKYVMDQPSQNPEDDTKLIEACKKSGKVILPFAGGMAPSQAPGDMTIAKKYVIQDQTQATKFLSFSNWAYPIAGLADSSVGVGSIDAEAPNRRIQKLPLLVRVGHNLYPSLQLIVVQKLLGVSWDKIVAKDGTLLIGAKSVPMDLSGMMDLRFSDPDRTYKIYSYTDILDENFKSDDLNDSVVIIGYDGSRFPVNFITTASKNHNGCQIQADGINALLSMASS